MLKIKQTQRKTEVSLQKIMRIRCASKTVSFDSKIEFIKQRLELMKVGRHRLKVKTTLVIINKSLIPILPTLSGYK